MRSPLRGARAACLGLLLFALAAGVGDAAAAAPPARLADVVVAEEPSGATVVRLAGAATAGFLAQVADGGTKIVLELDRVELAGAPPALAGEKGVVSGVLVQGAREGARVRVLVRLARPAAFHVAPSGGDLHLVLRPASRTAPDDRAGAAPHRAATPRPQGVVLRDVSFDHRVSHDRVILKLSGPVGYREIDAPPGRAAIELAPVVLPRELQRTLDVSAFGGPVRSVSAFARPSDPTRVVVEVERDEGAEGRVLAEGTSLVFAFGRGGLPSDLTGVGKDGGKARRARTVSREEDGGERDPFAPPRETVVEAAEAGAFLPAVAAQQRRYTGRRMDFDFKDADIHNILRLISDVGRVNIVTSDAVGGTVTLRMRNVPWDLALDTVLQAKGLGMVRQGNMIRVAPQADLAKERELALARRKAEMLLAPLETRLIPVSYAGAADLMARSKDLLSPRGTMAVDARTNVIIARDVAGNLNQIEELIRSLDTQTPQVLIEARIVEATSRYLRDVGIQWGGDAVFGAATGNPTGLVFPSSVGIVGGSPSANSPTSGLSPFTQNVPNPNFAVNLPATVGAGAGGALGLTFGSIANTINLSVRLSAAEASGMLRIISSPRILTLDNHEARISQGTLLPFSQVSAQGVQTIFQEAKLQLFVRPHVTADGSVSMRVKINRDEPDFNQTSARGDPTILKREAETELLVMDGHTAVIGGIFTRNSGRNVDQLPFFGDIPLLGVLFQRRRTTDTRSELVIFITPRIVNRAEALGR